MDKSQADAAARAILQPGLRMQEERRRKKTAKARLMARKRQVAWFALAGFAVGIVIAYFAGLRLVPGAWVGIILGAALGWLFAGLRGRSGAIQIRNHASRPN